MKTQTSPPSKTHHTLLLILLFTSATLTLDLEPVLISTVFRHGARVSYSNPFGDGEIADPIGRANLTMIGQRQELLLGAQLKLEYPKIFTDTPTNFDYELHSSPVPRCLNSANSFLLGAYPPKTGEVIPANFDNKLLLPDIEPKTLTVNPKISPSNAALPSLTRVFPIQTTDYLKDFFFFVRGYKVCKKAEKIRLETEKKQKSFCDDLKDTIDKLKSSKIDIEKVTGEKEWNCTSLAIFYDRVRSYYYLNQKFPEGISKEFYEEVERAFAVTWSNSDWSNPTLLKLRTTKIISRISEAFKARAEEKNLKLKFLMFSGHDSTVYPIQAGYGLTNPECLLKAYKEKKSGDTEGCRAAPGFGSSFVWELAKEKNTKNFFVKMLLNGKPVNFCKEAKVEGADFYCPLEIWNRKSFENLRIDEEEWENVCGREEKDEDKEGGLRPSGDDTDAELRMYETLSFLFTIFSIMLAGLLLCFVFRFFDLRNLQKGTGINSEGYTRTELRTEDGPAF